MKISKLFHWLYAILMFLPFGLLLFNSLASMCSGQIITFDNWISYFHDFFEGGDMFLNTVSITICDTYDYLIFTVFGLSGESISYVSMLLSYWTCISIIWLVFDVFMYVPLLVHRWIDKAKLE